MPKKSKQKQSVETDSISLGFALRIYASRFMRELLDVATFMNYLLPSSWALFIAGGTFILAIAEGIGGIRAEKFTRRAFQVLLAPTFALSFAVCALFALPFFLILAPANVVTQKRREALCKKEWRFQTKENFRQLASWLFNRKVRFYPLEKLLLHQEAFKNLSADEKTFFNSKASKGFARAVTQLTAASTVMSNATPKTRFREIEAFFEKYASPAAITFQLTLRISQIFFRTYQKDDFLKNILKCFEEISKENPKFLSQPEKKEWLIELCRYYEIHNQNPHLGSERLCTLIHLLHVAGVSNPDIQNILPRNIAHFQESKLQQVLATLTDTTPENMLKTTIDICDASQLWFEWVNTYQTLRYNAKSEDIQKLKDSIKKDLNAFFEAHTEHSNTIFQGLYHLCIDKTGHVVLGTISETVSLDALLWEMFVQHAKGEAVALCAVENLQLLCEQGRVDWVEAVPMLQKMGLGATQILAILEEKLIPRDLLGSLALTPHEILQHVGFILTLQKKCVLRGTAIKDILPEINTLLTTHPQMLPLIVKLCGGKTIQHERLEEMLYEAALKQIHSEAPQYPALASIDVLKQCFDKSYFNGKRYQRLIQAFRKLNAREEDIYAYLAEKNIISNTHQTLSAKIINDLVIQTETLLDQSNRPAVTEANVQTELCDILKDLPMESLQVSLDYMLKHPEYHIKIQHTDDTGRTIRLTKRQFIFNLFTTYPPLSPHFEDKNNLLMFFQRIETLVLDQSQMLELIYLMRRVNLSDSEIIKKLKSSSLFNEATLTEEASTAILDTAIQVLELSKNSNMLSQAEILEFLNKHSDKNAAFILFNAFPIMPDTEIKHPAVLCFEQLEHHFLENAEENAVTSYFSIPEHFKAFLPYIARKHPVSKERILTLGRKMGYYDAGIYQLANLSDDEQLVEEDELADVNFMHSKAAETGVMLSVAKLKWRLYPEAFEASLKQGTTISPLDTALTDPWLKRVEQYVQEQFKAELKQISPTTLWNDLSDRFALFNAKAHGTIQTAFDNMNKSEAYKAIEADKTDTPGFKANAFDKLRQKEVMERHPAEWQAFMHFIEESIPIVVQDCLQNLARFPDPKAKERGDHQHSHSGTNLIQQKYIQENGSTEVLTIFTTVAEILALTWQALEDKTHEDAFPAIAEINKNPNLSEAEKEKQKEEIRQDIRKMWIPSLVGSRTGPGKGSYGGEGTQRVCSGGVSEQLLVAFTKRHRDINFTPKAVTIEYSPTEITKAGIVDNLHRLMFESLEGISKEDTLKNAIALLEFFKAHPDGFLNSAASELPPLPKQFIDNLFNCFKDKRLLKDLFSEIPDSYQPSEADIRFIQRTLNANSTEISKKLEDYIKTKERESKVNLNALSAEIDEVFKNTKDSQAQYKQLHPLFATLCDYLISANQTNIKNLMSMQKRPVFERYQDRLNGKTMDDFTKDDLMAIQKSMEAELEALGPEAEDSEEKAKQREQLKGALKIIPQDLFRLQTAAQQLGKRKNDLKTLQTFQATVSKTNTHVTTPHTLETISQLGAQTKQTLADLLSQHNTDVQVMIESVGFLDWPEGHGVDLATPAVGMITTPMLTDASPRPVESTPQATAMDIKTPTKRKK